MEPQQPDEDGSPPSLASLIFRGLLIILGAFISAAIILSLHMPVVPAEH